jgi:hypothetical protein
MNANHFPLCLIACKWNCGPERLSSGANHNWNRTRVAQQALCRSKYAGSGLLVHDSGIIAVAKRCLICREGTMLREAKLYSVRWPQATLR